MSCEFIPRSSQLATRSLLIKVSNDEVSDTTEAEYIISCPTNNIILDKLQKFSEIRKDVVWLC